MVEVKNQCPSFSPDLHTQGAHVLERTYAYTKIFFNGSCSLKLDPSSNSGISPTDCDLSASCVSHNCWARGFPEWMIYPWAHCLKIFVQYYLKDDFVTGKKGKMKADMRYLLILREPVPFSCLQTTLTLLRAGKSGWTWLQSSSCIFC